MAQIAKIAEKVQLKSSGEKFFEFFKNKMDYFPRMFAGNVESYKFVEGNSFTHGSVSIWKYDIGFGRAVEVKMKLLVDEANKTIIYECLEGDLFKDFDMFKVKIEVTDGGSSGNSSVNWCLEFVKSNENVAPPNDYLQFGVKICKDVDAYLSNN
ncbi:MLP-like protein 34 [Cucumis sativus]|uniref:MLP-like protein 34 n=1 Tax=Cucumis sativus TaxID=3659 RepID=UPI0002B46568|nr:MLP-like protein 34 [Cucumis sativus]